MAKKVRDEAAHRRLQNDRSLRRTQVTRRALGVAGGCGGERVVLILARA